SAPSPSRSRRALRSSRPPWNAAGRRRDAPSRHKRLPRNSGSRMNSDLVPLADLLVLSPSPGGPRRIVLLRRRYYAAVPGSACFVVFCGVVCIGASAGPPEEPDSSSFARPFLTADDRDLTVDRSASREFGPGQLVLVVVQVHEP